VSTDTATTIEAVRRIVAEVADPEIPVLTIEDLGVLRDVTVDDSGHVEVTITPTYSGCPAMDVIADDIRHALHAAGRTGDVRTVLAPAWTTDWMTDAGRQKLHEYGIAPPAHTTAVDLHLSVRCPQCGSPDTRQVSRFGSTACQAQWVCQSCHEPFDEFKPH
jgi:ring-1,2-phenylacetyl-CoA epoxidase subunit PaaD